MPTMAGRSPAHRGVGTRRRHPCSLGSPSGPQRRRAATSSRVTPVSHPRSGTRARRRGFWPPRVGHVRAARRRAASLRAVCRNGGSSARRRSPRRPSGGAAGRARTASQHPYLCHGVGIVPAISRLLTPRNAGGAPPSVRLVISRATPGSGQASGVPSSEARHALRSAGWERHTAITGGASGPNGARSRDHDLR